MSAIPSNTSFQANSLVIETWNGNLCFTFWKNKISSLNVGHIARNFDFVININLSHKQVTSSICQNVLVPLIPRLKTTVFKQNKSKKDNLLTKSTTLRTIIDEVLLSTEESDRLQ